MSRGNINQTVGNYMFNAENRFHLVSKINFNMNNVSKYILCINKLYICYFCLSNIPIIFMIIETHIN